MPGMGGIELQRHLVAGHSEVPVIFITAHEDEGMLIVRWSAQRPEFATDHGFRNHKGVAGPTY